MKKQKEGLTLASTATRRFANTMVSPTVIILLVMTAYPLIFTLIYSFTDYNLMKRNTSFVALKNYADLLGNAYFRQAIWNTVKFTVLTVALEMVCGFFLALFVNSAIENPILGSIGFTVPALGAVVYLIFDRKLKKEAGENKETNDG